MCGNNNNNNNKALWQFTPRIGEWMLRRFRCVQIFLHARPVNKEQKSVAQRGRTPVTTRVNRMPIHGGEGSVAIASSTRVW